MIDRYRNYRPERPVPTPRKKSRRGLYIFVAIILISVGGKAIIGRNADKEDSAPQPAKKSQAAESPKADPIKTTAWHELSQQMNTIIEENSAFDISVAVIDINNNTKANYGIQESFAGASTTKVLTAVAFLQDVEAKRHTLTESLSGATAETHINRMINVSDNNSWAVLNQAVTSQGLESFARSIGITSYRYNGNTVTTTDMALLLQKLYKGQLLNREHTKLLYEAMQNTNNETMIPVVTPKGAQLYHKYGQLEDRLHDVAIIDYKERPISLAIYTKGGAADGSNYGARAALVQKLAEAVVTNIYSSSD
jgi:beta-lactamase class A